MAAKGNKLMTETRLRARSVAARTKPVVAEQKKTPDGGDAVVPARKPWVKPTLTTFDLARDTAGGIPGKSIPDAGSSAS